MRHAAKRFLSGVAPKTAARIFAARARAHAHRCYAEWGCLELNRKILAAWGAQVQSGPFAGMQLSPETFCEHLAPCLLGTYESELHPAWSEILAGRYSQLADIGAKFGYYAVGLARRFPVAEIVAFDTDPWARRAIAEMCAANRAPNISIRSFCTPEWLRRELKPGAFVLSDCEGFENRLFARCEGALASATLLIETHEQACPGVTGRIAAAFSQTHRATEIAAEPRVQAPEAIRGFSPAEQHLALNEFRTGPQKWLWMAPRSAQKS